MLYNLIAALFTSILNATQNGISRIYSDSNLRKQGRDQERADAMQKYENDKFELLNETRKIDHNISSESLAKSLKDAKKGGFVKDMSN